MGEFFSRYRQLINYVMNAVKFDNIFVSGLYFVIIANNNKCQHIVVFISFR
jgi:hypothetical protein